jgi:hypothetical protein
MRRTAVHFWPVFWVISFATSVRKRFKVSAPAATSGPSTAEFKLSASTFTCTLCCASASVLRSCAAVSPEPVKARTSCPVR